MCNVHTAPDEIVPDLVKSRLGDPKHFFTRASRRKFCPRRRSGWKRRGGTAMSKTFLCRCPRVCRTGLRGQTGAVAAQTTELTRPGRYTSPIIGRINRSARPRYGTTRHDTTRHDTRHTYCTAVRWPQRPAHKHRPRRLHRRAVVATGCSTNSQTPVRYPTGVENSTSSDECVALNETRFIHNRCRFSRRQHTDRSDSSVIRVMTCHTSHARLTRHCVITWPRAVDRLA